MLSNIKRKLTPTQFKPFFGHFIWPDKKDGVLVYLLHVIFIQLQDTNAMNNMMSNMYKSTPTTSRTSSPKANAGVAVADFTQIQKMPSDPSAACITIDDSSDSNDNPSLEREAAQFDAFRIDRLGDQMYMKPQHQSIMLPVMQGFLPQNVMMNPQILTKQAPPMGEVPRPVNPAEVEARRNVDNVSVISDVTEISVAEKSMNSKPSKVTL